MLCTVWSWNERLHHPVTLLWKAVGVQGYTCCLTFNAMKVDGPTSSLVDDRVSTFIWVCWVVILTQIVSFSVKEDLTQTLQNLLDRFGWWSSYAAVFTQWASTRLELTYDMWHMTHSVRYDRKLFLSYSSKKQVRPLQETYAMWHMTQWVPLRPKAFLLYISKKKVRPRQVTYAMWHMTQWVPLRPKAFFSFTFQKNKLGPPSSDLCHVTYDCV